VTWVNEYQHLEHGEKRALEIIQDIDRRYIHTLSLSGNFLIWTSRLSAVPGFPGLRRFPDGCDFHQWTGDDSKAFMKVKSSCIYII
jgi:hypothetical protein